MVSGTESVVGNDRSGGTDDGAELALRVFAGEERWGWEFVQPPAPPAHRDAHNPPAYSEPSDQEVRAMEERVESGESRGTGCLVLIAGGIAYAAGGAGAALIVAVLVFAAMAATSPSARLRAARRRLEAARVHAQRDYEKRLGDWRSRIDAHREEHLRHNATLDTWYPLVLASGPSRIDVFGGTGNGWASLLATVGGPLLGSGRPLVVLDLTQQAVALELAGLAAHRDIAVTHVPMPGGLLDLDLREEFTPDQLAETVAEAVATMRPSGADVDLFTIDVDVVQTVAELLEGPVTFTRLAAGLRVLLRVYDAAPDAPGVLSASEVESITRAVDFLGQGERVQNELRYMRAQAELLTPRGEEAPDPGGRAADWWRPAGLTIVTTEDSVRRRKDLADRFVFFRLLHLLRMRAVPHGSGTLVVAGADHLGRDALESMAREARSAGVRLVFLLEHLREGTVQVAGGSDSATVFMRMGNGEEAKAAADFIGQEHTFLVNQLTRQVGQTLTEGRGSSYSYQRGVSHSDGSTKGGGTSGTTWGRSRSVSTSLSRSWQDSTNTSTAHSTTTGENLSRVYEFTVEPTQLQALPVTGLVLVEAGPGGRRVVFGDCNPGITFLPRLSARPRASLT
ncbi:hypothetical protein ABTY98_41000 [Streptomyces sp. NPDC096040]|uniref:hypothetical protein n=1 Tax=Streptomyces sp. NPDC096040 TaxID=3155541 RepID=UPI003322FAC8